MEAKDIYIRASVVLLATAIFMCVSCATTKKVPVTAPQSAPAPQTDPTPPVSQPAPQPKMPETSTLNPSSAAPSTIAAAQEKYKSAAELQPTLSPESLLYVRQLPLLSMPDLPPSEHELPPMPAPEMPPSPYSIMGQGSIGEEKLAAFLLAVNHSIDPIYVRTLAKIYVEEADAEGVNYETAFSQMCLETGYLRFGGLVTPDMNNFGGLGATGRERGLAFPSPRIGVRAQIQHLKAYATAVPPKQELVDPRYRLVRYGCAPTVDGLSGTWAADKEYGAKLRKMIDWLRNS
ncbi:MAG: hypothetical protein Ta2G_21650 [Termitinemataceae bacterium]|nr:MAG: hypothetical protein Ta2G_21650 [Termitinemataceae bacterium]